MKNNKTTTIIMMIAAIFVLSVAYAAFSTSLTINGTASIASTWSVSLANAACSATTTKDSGTPSNCTASISGNVITAGLNFASPGDVLTLTFDIVNNGSLDASADVMARMRIGDDSSADCGNVTTQGKVLPYTASGADGTFAAKTPVTIAKTNVSLGTTTILSKTKTTTYNKASYQITFTYNASATSGAGSVLGCKFTGTATVTQA